MKIADLFIGLGIKGDDKTNKALKGTKSGLADVKSMSIEAKAAIIGAIYALERLMSSSAQQGAGLMNFNALTGLSTQALQEWQYAARQAGVSSEELTGSVKGVQNAMTNMLLGKGAPEGMAMLANKVGFDEKKARDTFYVMKKLQEFAKSAPPDISSNLMKSFGLNEGVISAMQRNMFRDDIFKNAPKYSQAQIVQLDKVNSAWANLGQKIEMAMGKFTAKHGMQLISDLEKITPQVLKLVEALVTLADKTKVFQLIGKAFEGWGLILEGINKQLTDINKDSSGPATALAKKAFTVTDADRDLFNMVKNMVTPNDIEESVSNKNLATPVVKGIQPPVQNKEINVTQTLQFQHDGKDHKKTGDSVKKAIKETFWQMSPLNQGN